MRMQTIERIRFFLGSKAPRPVYFICVFFRKVYKKLRMPQQNKHFGNLNKDKTFFVIRLFPPATGFLANYNYVLGYMHYAFQHGWIPVIDMENYGTLYQEDAPINGTRNVWEYYFLQPYDEATQRRYSLGEVYQSRNVILSDASMELTDFSNDPETLCWQKKMASLVPFNSCSMDYIKKIYADVIPKNKKVIGVPSRGSEQKKRVIGHPIPISPNELFPILDKRIIEWYGSSEDIFIFVKAEEQSTIDQFKNKISNVCYSQASRIMECKNLPASNATFGNKNVTRYQSTLEYLTDIYILSRCNSLIGTMNNGLYTAIIWNDKFEHLEIINKGRYR